MSDSEIYKKAIETYGAKHQEMVAIEECSELIQAITHKNRGRHSNIVEEIADVEIMLEQLKIIHGCPITVDIIKRLKIERLRNRLEMKAFD